MLSRSKPASLSYGLPKAWHPPVSLNAPGVPGHTYETALSYLPRNSRFQETLCSVKAKAAE